MNLSEKKDELIQLISGYLGNEVSLEQLQKFSWEIVGYFSKRKKNELPPHQDFEKEFWYTLWQVQHLADEQHEKEGITKKVLMDALDYLQKKKRLPQDFIGKRP